MTEKDRLLYRLLARIHEHGYYHQVDVALVDWFLTNTSVKEVCEKYLVQPDALYQQRSRLRKMEV